MHAWRAGNAWQADHIRAVHLGGGLCDITNFRTLCTICHARVTKEQATRRAQMRAAGNTHTLTALFSSQNSNIARRAEQAASGDVDGRSGEAGGGAGGGRSKRKASTILENLAKGAAKRLAAGSRRGKAGLQNCRLGGNAVQATLMHGGRLHVRAPRKLPGSQCAPTSSGARTTVALVDSDSDFETDGAKLLRPPARAEHDTDASPSAGGGTSSQGSKEKSSAPV